MVVSLFREALRLGCVNPDGFCHKSSPSPPPAPDYSGAAQATAAGNKENTIAAQQGSMVNQYTPYGNMVYSQGQDWANGNPSYNATINLTPQAQSTLDAQLAMSRGLGELGTSTLGRTEAAYAQPFDQSSVGDIANNAYSYQTARLDPQWAANDKAKASELSNQGIMQGSEAYDNAMRTYNQARNDAYTQARQAAISTMPQTYQLATAAREQPLNELNAIRTGAQIQNPTFAQTPQQQAAPGANYLGAAQAQGAYDQGIYNSQVGSANSFNSGLMGLGGAIGSAAIKFSDRRMKYQIVRIGTHPIGIGLYKYEIAGIPTTGVMADEVLAVKPEAVITTPSGYLAVNYGAL